MNTCYARERKTVRYDRIKEIGGERERKPPDTIGSINAMKGKKTVLRTRELRFNGQHHTNKTTAIGVKNRNGCFTTYPPNAE